MVIESVVLFLADLTGQGRFNKSGGALVRVTPPSAFLQQADTELGFNGELMKWIEDHGIAQRFEQFTSGDEWKGFVMQEFPGRKLHFRNCRTQTIGYNLVVVMA